MTIAKNFRSTKDYKSALKEIVLLVREGKNPYEIDFKTDDKHWAAALYEVRRRWDKRENQSHIQGIETHHHPKQGVVADVDEHKQLIWSRIRGINKQTDALILVADYLQELPDFQLSNALLAVRDARVWIVATLAPEESAAVPIAAPKPKPKPKHAKRGSKSQSTFRGKGAGEQSYAPHNKREDGYNGKTRTEVLNEWKLEEF